MENRKWKMENNQRSHNMKKNFKLIVLIILAALLHCGYLQAQTENQASSCAIEESLEQCEDVLITFYTKCYILNELWGILNAYLNADLDGYPCDGKSDFYYLNLKLGEKSSNLRMAEFELAQRHNEFEKLNDIVEELYITNEAKPLYEKYDRIFQGHYPANLEFAKIFRVKADVMERIYKELLGPEISVCFETDRFSDLIAKAKTQNRLKDEEIIEGLKQHLMSIYIEEIESYNRFIEENKVILQEAQLFAREEFKCGKVSGEYDNIKVLRDILPVSKKPKTQ